MSGALVLYGFLNRQTLDSAVSPLDKDQRVWSGDTAENPGPCVTCVARTNGSCLPSARCDMAMTLAVRVLIKF